MLIFILTIGVFSIINTEMGVIGILPLIAERYGVVISEAGLLVSLFALAVAVAGPTLPLLFSRYNRKTVMIAVLAAFTLCNAVSAFAENFTVLLIARTAPAFLHPVYISLAFAAAAAQAGPEEAPKAAAKVMVGVSAGMVLGVPVVSWVAEATSLTTAMLFFAALNGAALAATICFVPSMPPSKVLSYGAQLRVLRDSGLWLAFFAVICLNGSIFGVFSYLADYLDRVSGYAPAWVSTALFVYGSANIAGNLIAGRLLSRRAARTVFLFPFVLGALYIWMALDGAQPYMMAVILLLWGILAGIAANIHQYWIASAAPEVPDFANALFLVAANLGTCIAAAVCGWIIDAMGIDAVVFGGLAFLAGSLLFFLPGLYQRRRAVGKAG